MNLLNFLSEHAVYLIVTQAIIIIFVVTWLYFVRAELSENLTNSSILDLVLDVSGNPDTVRILEINPDGLIISTNFAAYNAGINLAGTHIRELFAPEDLAERINHIQRAFREKRAIKTQLNYQNHIYSNKIIPIFKNGKPERVIVISADVTTITKQNLHLQESASQFNTITDTLPGTVFRMDLQSTANPFVYLSKQIFDLTGYAAAEFMSGRISFYSLMLPEDFSRITQILAGDIIKEDIDIEYRLTHANGEIRWVLHKARITADEAGKPKWKDGIMLDITRQRKTEEARDLAYQIIENISILQSAQITEKSKDEIFRQALTQLKELTKSQLGGIGENFLDDREQFHSATWILCKDAFNLGFLDPETGRHILVNSEVNRLIAEILKTDEVVICRKSQNHDSLSAPENFIGLPVKSGKTLMAIVWLGNKPGGYGQSDITLLKPILKTLGTMLGNLREQQRRRKTEYKVLDLNLALKQFKFALNNTSIVSITDLEGRIKYANQKFSRISQYSRDELMGKNHRIINSSYHPKAFWKEMWETIHSGNLWRGEVQNKAKDGTLYWVDTFIVPILDSKRNIIEFMSIRNDITEKKKHEAQLRILSLVARETSNFVVITDRDRRIEWVNKSFETGMGYSLHELQGHDFMEALHINQNSNSIIHVIKKPSTDQQPVNFEFPVQSKDGETLWVQMNWQPIQDEHGHNTRFFALLRNISKQKQLIASLEDARHQAEESDRLKSSFLANVSHEIRTPMNAIMGFSELLERPVLEESKRNQFTKLIRQSSEELLSIVNDILNISKLEAGQTSIQFTTGSVQQMLDQLEEHYTAQVQWIHNKPIAIKTFNNVAHAGAIRTDFNHLQQVLNNLISNALKFTSQGVIEFGCLQSDDNELVFTVRDSGIGIAPEYHELIFKPFRQINASQHLKTGGTGLGLAIAKGLVTLWGGEIKVSSDGRKGSLFTFTIPFSQTRC